MMYNKFRYSDNSEDFSKHCRRCEVAVRIVSILSILTIVPPGPVARDHGRQWQWLESAPEVCTQLALRGQAQVPISARDEL